LASDYESERTISETVDQDLNEVQKLKTIIKHRNYEK